MIAAFVLWLSYVLCALLWTGAVVGVLGAFTIAIGLCRIAKLSDAMDAAREEIDL